MEVNYKKYIKDEYRSLLEEAFSILSDCYKVNSMRKKIFPQNERIKKEFLNELHLYLKCVMYQRKVCKFIYKNEKELNGTCIDRGIDLLEEYGEANFRHMDYMISMLKTACEMEADYKFYMPRKKFEYIDENVYQKFIRLLCGYDIQNVKDFLVNCDVMNLEEYDKIYGSAKVLPISCVDTTFIGDFEGGFSIPKVVDDKTALVCLHVLVHQSLKFNKQYIDNDKIVYGEELPIFYEMLYKAYNGFIKCNTNQNEISKQLLDNYESEPFMEQVRKLEKLI